MTARLTVVGVIAVALVGCGGGGGGGGDDVGTANLAPVAQAGNDRSEAISATGNTLDGSASVDPDGGALTYTWQISEQPPNGDGVLQDASSSIARLVATVPGVYQVRLSVGDDRGATDSDLVQLNLRNTAPIAEVAYSRNALPVADVTLDAGLSSDPNGHPLTYAWQLVEKPPESTIPDTYTGVAPTVVFDVEGDYTFNLDLDDGYDPVSLELDTIAVTRLEAVALNGPVSDAEYDETNNRLVVIDESVLRIIEADGAETALDLPLPGAAVSLAPGGNRAVIGHNGWVTSVDLATVSIESTLPVAAEVGDIVVDGNGYAYVFPATGQWTRIIALNLADGTTAQHTGNSVRDGTRARLHPSGTKIYGADNGWSPSDVERYSIGGGAVNLDYDSPYHGDFPFCGDLWMGVGGATMLTRCGVVVRTNDSPAFDLTFVSQLISGNWRDQIRHADATPFSNRWYVAAGNSPSRIDLFDATTSTAQGAMALPYVDDFSAASRWEARFVFADDDSDAVFIVAQESDTSTASYALLTQGSTGGQSGNLPPVAKVTPFRSVRTSQPVTLDGSLSSDAEGAALAYAWTVTSQPEGSDVQLAGLGTNSLQFTPIVPGVYEVLLVVNDGNRDSAVARSEVSVFEAGASMVYRLADEVSDAEFSKSLNRLVYVSADSAELKLFDIDTGEAQSIDLPLPGFRVGVSPDGTHAAVSHQGLVSLVSLTTLSVIDSQAIVVDWGDIVLDHNNRAHVTPRRDQWVDMISVDFAADTSYNSGRGRAGSQMRMHPTENWIYAADRGLSPSDFEKYDVTSMPGIRVGDSPYHGDYRIDGNIWISEPGDRLLTARGNAFWSRTDPAIDMTYSGALSDAVFVVSADHSAERDEWVVASSDAFFGPVLPDRLLTYSGAFLTRVSDEAFAPIPTVVGDAPTTALNVFFDDAGSKVILLLQSDGAGVGANNKAVQIRELQ